MVKVIKGQQKLDVKGFLFRNIQKRMTIDQDYLIS